MRRLKYLTVNRRRLFRINAAIEKIVNEMNEKVPEGELRGVKFAMFRPPT